MKNIFTFLMILGGLFMSQANAQFDSLQVIEGPCSNGVVLEAYKIILNGTELDPFEDCKYAFTAAEVVAGANELSIEDGDGQLSPLAGVSTLDLVLLFRGLFSGFDSNFQVIAADFDGDNVVSTKDLVEMRRLILGLELEGEYRAYRLLDYNYDFPPDFGPFNFGSDFTSFSFDSDDLGGVTLPLRVVKAGDLNDTGFFQSEEQPVSIDAATLIFQDREVEAGQTYNVAFDLNSTSNFRASTFEFVTEGLTILSIDNNDNDILYNKSLSNSKLSYFSDQPESSVEFSIEVEATADGILSEMLRLDLDFFQEVVDIDGNVREVQLLANVVSDVDDFSSEQFYLSPNPVGEILNVSFENYSNATMKRVELISLDGKSIYSDNTMGDKLSIEMSSIGAKGLHLIRVTQAGKTKLEKVMIQ